MIALRRLGHETREMSWKTKMTPVRAIKFYFNFFSSPYEKETSMETEDLPYSMDSTFVLDQTADGKFLSLDDVGKVLTSLASMGMISAFVNA